MLSTKKDSFSVENSYVLRGLDLAKQSLQFSFLWPLKDSKINMIGRSVIVMNMAVFIILLVSNYLYECVS